MSRKAIERLRQERSEAIQSGRAIIDAADAAERALTPEEAGQFKETMERQKALQLEIDVREAQLSAEMDLGNLRGERASQVGHATEESRAELRAEAYRAFLRADGNVSDEVRAEAHRMGISDFRAESFGDAKKKGSSYDGTGYGLRDTRSFNKHRREYRAQSIATAGAGPELAPEGFMPRLEDQLLAFGGMLQVAEVIRTNNGNDIPWPGGDQTALKGRIVPTEHDEQEEKTLAFSTKTLGSHLYESGALLIPRTLTEDSAIDVESYSGGKVGESIGRIQNEHFTTGSGSGEPEGVTVGAGDSTIVTAGLGVVTADELLELKHSVNSAYRKGAQFMFSDDSFLQISKLKDGDGQYIWAPGLARGTRDTIHQSPFAINDDMPSLGTAGARAVLYGLLSKYKIRMVRAIQIDVVRELYARRNQVGIWAFMRADGKLINSNAVKYLANAAS